MKIKGSQVRKDRMDKWGLDPFASYEVRETGDRVRFNIELFELVDDMGEVVALVWKDEFESEEKENENQGK